MFVGSEDADKYQFGISTEHKFMTDTFRLVTDILLLNPRVYLIIFLQFPIMRGYK